MGLVEFAKSIISQDEALDTLRKSNEFKEVKIAALEKELKSLKEPGVTVIRIGKAVCGFRSGGILGVQLVVNAKEIAYSARSDRLRDLSSFIRHECQVIARKLEEGILEHIQKEGL